MYLVTYVFLRQPVMQTPRTQVRNDPCMVAFGGRYGIHIGYANNSSKMFALHEGEVSEIFSIEIGEFKEVAHIILIH